MQILVNLDGMHRAAGNVFTYRGYIIRPDLAHPYGGWIYTHEQYDGPPDPRCGHAETVAIAQLEIDDLHEVWPEKHGDRFADYPLACHGQLP